MSNEIAKACIHQQMRILQESHMQQMNALIVRLAELQALEIPTYILTREQYEALQLPASRQSDHQLHSDVVATKGK